MTVYANDIVIDGGIDKVIADADVVHLLNAFTSDYATVVANSFGSFTPSITEGDRTPNGRNAILAAAAGVAITTGGAGIASHSIVISAGPAAITGIIVSSKVIV